MALVLIQNSASAASSHLASVNPDLVWSVALLAALGYAMRSARLSGLNVRFMYWTAAWALLGGLWARICFRCWYTDGRGGPLAVFQFMQGEKSLFGGLLMGGVAAALYLHHRRVPLLAYADAGVPALALGYAVGRIGCFLNGDDFGTLTHARCGGCVSAGDRCLRSASRARLDFRRRCVFPANSSCSALCGVAGVLLCSWRSQPGVLSWRVVDCALIWLSTELAGSL